MTADVNVTERAREAALARWALGSSDTTQMLMAVDAALAALSDPEVLAGIAGVLRDTFARTACGGDPTAAGEVGDWLPEAAAVVEWLRGQG